MDDGGWNEVANSNDKEGYRKLIKNTVQAAKLDMAGKAVAAGDDPLHGELHRRALHSAPIRGTAASSFFV